MPEPDFKQRLEAYFALCNLEASRSLEKYLDKVFIDTKPVAKSLKSILEPWQAERHKIIAPALEYAAGLRKTYTGPRNFWWECMRGLDKTSSLARYCNWLLAYSKTPLNIIACAADRDQAGLLYAAMIKQAELPENKWFRDKLDFQTKAVFGPGGKLTIMASDGDTNQGQSPDILICDEVTVWRKSDLWDTMYSTGLKRPDTFVCIVISNTGHIGTWSHKLREAVRTSPEEWYFWTHPECTYPASWMTPERIEAARKKMVSAAEASRLLDNKWISLTEESPFTSLEEVAGCIGTPLPPPPMSTVVLTLDYGSGVEDEKTGDTRDRAAAATIWWDGEKVHAYEVKCWDGGDTNKEVPVSEIVNWVEERLLRYPGAVIVADKYQLLGEIQKWEARGVPIERVKFLGGDFNVAIANCLKELIRTKKIVFAADAGKLGNETLLTELVDLVEVQKSYGRRFENAPGKHDDRAFVVAVGAHRALRGDPPITIPPSKQKTEQFYRPKSLNPLGHVQHLNWAARKGLFGLGAAQDERFIQMQ